MNTARVLYLPPSEELRFLPEGPYPLENNRFSWVGIQHGATNRVGSINVFDLDSQTNVSYPLHGRPGFAFPTDHGNFVAGVEREVGIYSPETGSWTPFITGVDSDVQGTIINDGVTWSGNLIFGTKDLEFKTRKAGLYLWRRSDRQLIRLRTDQICSNGKFVVEIAPSLIDLYDIDSPTLKVVCYRIDIAQGKIVSERTVVDFSQVGAVPDGMVVSPDGKHVVVSLYNPNAAPYGRTVMASIESGSIVETWQTPGSPQNTCPQWLVYQGKCWLVITTAVEHMPVERQGESPNAGGLFLAETDFSLDPANLRTLAPVFVE